MICFPNAKINLGLNVVRKRKDGYHDIETIFYPIPIIDALEIIPSEHLSLIQSGITIDGSQEHNLVMKAYRLLKKDFPEIPQLEINLLKKIPFGAGLGGGSSDGAFMLKMMNDLLHLNMTDEVLEKKALSLGADCPFFIKDEPVFASGTGNIFESINISLNGFYLILIKPNILVSTPEAYSKIKPKNPSISLKEIIQKPLLEWKELMKNDFEESVFIRHPIIGEIKNALYSAGALYASMSGSGSSVFGIFEKPISMKSNYPDYFVWEGVLK